MQSPLIIGNLSVSTQAITFLFLHSDYRQLFSVCQEGFSVNKAIYFLLQYADVQNFAIK